MKKQVLFLLLLLQMSVEVFSQKIVEKDFESIFKKNGFVGSFLLYDLSENTYTAYNYQRCLKGFIPASTFKIPNSLIALETGIVQDETTTLKWDGVEREIKNWNQDLCFQNALKYSCVPCYQAIARQVGAKKYQDFFKKFSYGKMDVTPQNVDMFWLEGKSIISQKEQVDFLVKLYKNQLPFTKRNMEIVKTMLLLETKPNYILRGKTGWATNIIKAGTENEKEQKNNIGWFVGWVTKGTKVYFFANNIEAINPDKDKFINARKSITEEIFKTLNIL
ncbi:class D beta-lactamase [Arcicella rigui]|uniref:Beta-lactamase n=1 Tax=Arcicella rigui TaxID=797020 RepID=A0ABU5Q6N5_9BACT|nr:class D beta-lactamase [Arcicella rigui]MEA5138413.1 class D beta-lactamase [Arcicella rigui]